MHFRVDLDLDQIVIEDMGGQKIYLSVEETNDLIKSLNDNVVRLRLQRSLKERRHLENEEFLTLDRLSVL